MIDFGLLVSMVIGFGAPSLVALRWPLTGHDDSVSFFDLALVPALLGLAVGRLAALALDDPTSLGSLSDMVIIRSGVEFWPGVATATAAVMVGARRADTPSVALVANLAPLAMVGYAGYEAGCVFRDGCFGPRTAVGLSPPGVDATMLPIGWFVAAAVVAGAVGVRRLARAGVSPGLVVGTAVVIVAGVRAVASIWLPHVGDGLTRQHATSIGVAMAGAVLVGYHLVTGRGRARSTSAAAPLSVPSD